MKRTLLMVLALSIVLGLAGMVKAQETQPQPKPAPTPPLTAPSAIANRASYFLVGLTGGIMVDPDMGSGIVSLDYYITDDVAVGPYFYFGGGGNSRYWAVAGQIKFNAALADNPDIRPYAFVGIGFLTPDFVNLANRDMTWFVPVGGGMEFELTDIIFLDTGTVFMLTDDTFAGLNVGVRVIL